jgi:hypothetical protein
MLTALAMLIRDMGRFLSDDFQRHLVYLSFHSNVFATGRHFGELGAWNRFQ